MILEGWTMVVTMHCWWSKPKQMRLQKLTTNSVLVKWGWDQWRGCEGARSKVIRGRGRGRGRVWEGRGLREVRRRRGAGEGTCKKRWEKTCPVFFFIFRRWQVALSAICKLLNMKKNSLHNLSEGKFSKGGIFVSLPKWIWNNDSFSGQDFCFVVYQTNKILNLPEKEPFLASAPVMPFQGGRILSII